MQFYLDKKSSDPAALSLGATCRYEELVYTVMFDLWLYVFAQKCFTPWVLLAWTAAWRLFTLAASCQTATWSRPPTAWAASRSRQLWQHRYCPCLCTGGIFTVKTLSRKTEIRLVSKTEGCPNKYVKTRNFHCQLFFKLLCFLSFIYWISHV